MTHKHLKNLSHRAQEQYLNILLSKLVPTVRQATLEVAQWLATERLGDKQVTPAQVMRWIEDVRISNEERCTPASAVILPFRRIQ